MDSDGAATTDDVIWQVQMFGRLRVRCAMPHMPLVVERFQTQKTALLWALLVSQQALSGKAPPLYRDDLAARLWPDARPETGRDRLSQALSWLRRNFEANAGLSSGTVIQADRRIVGLAKGVVTSDAARMDALLKEERANGKDDLARSALLLRQAIALYDGPLLPGICEDDDLLLLERQRFEALFQSTVRRAALVSAETGEGAQALEYARRLMRIDPANENDCALLMRLLFRTGDASGALRAYADFAARLAPDNAAPPAALLRLAEDIKERIAPSANPPANPRAASPPAPSIAPAAAQISTHLPLPLTRYFGREQELNVLQAALEARPARLITLLGPGGSGKTRLAIEAARRFADQDADVSQAETSHAGRAAFFVTLENISAGEQIMPAILRALMQAGDADRGEGAAHTDGPTLRAAVARLLAPFAHPLLVLDNAESIAGEVGAVMALADLLARVPALSLVATSRARLGVDGEQQLFVAPLPIPHQALPQINGTSEDANAAAARRDSLLLYPSVQMFLDRARHARLGFALSEENRDIIAALCARLEGMPLAIELCAAWANTLSPSEMLAALDNRFDLLVSRRPDVPPRHRSLYAAVESSYLQLPPDLKQAFAALSVFRGGWSAHAAQAVIVPDMVNATVANLRVRNALAALQERSLIIAETLPGTGGTMRWRMLDTLREFAWSQLSEHEGADVAARHAAWCLQFAEASGRQPPDLDPKQWLDTLEIEQDNFQAALAAWRSRTLSFNNAPDSVSPNETASEVVAAGEAVVSGEAAPSPLTPPVIMAARLCVALDRFWLTRGYSRVASDHLAWFLPHLQNAASDLLSGAETALLLARGYTALGRAYAAQGDLPTALAPLESALQTWRMTDNPAGVAGAQMDLGEVCYWLGRKSEGLALLEESEVGARQMDDALLCASVLLTLGSIALDEQDITRAERLHREALAFARRRDNRRQMGRILCNLGEIAREQGQLAEARERCEEALKAADIGDRAAGCYIRLSLGRTACAANDPGQATMYLRDCLRYVVKSGTRRQIMLCLLLAAQIARLQRQAARCALLLGAGSALRDEASLRLIQGEAQEEAALIAAARQALGDATYQETFARGAALSADDALAFALNDADNQTQK